MKKTWNKTELFKADHTKFGGYVFPSDFHTGDRKQDNANGSPIANRIAKDQRFDMQCKRNKENVPYLHEKTAMIWNF